MSQPASPEFRAFCEQRLEQLLVPARMYIADGTQHPTLFIADSTKCPGETAIIPFDIESDEDRESGAMTHKLMASRPDIVSCVTFITEAWAVITTAKPSEPDPAEINGSLEHAPGHTEVLSFSFMRGDMQLIAICPITRPDNTVEKGPLLDLADGMMGGRFVHTAPVVH